MSCYRPQRSCGQGNIFTPVCHSVHGGGGGVPGLGGVVSHKALRQTPPRPGTHPPGPDTPTPPDQTHHPPGPGTPPPPTRTRHTTPSPPGPDTPPTRHTPLDQTHHPPPGSRLRHTVYERPVRILLECILVETISLHPFACSIQT